MMFKAISMHTKPLKHTKKNANTNELHQKKHDFLKISYECQLFEMFVKNFHSHILHAPSYGCFLPFS